MVYLTRKAEFAASHFYHNPEFTPEENQRIFGKCNNPNGHGHNYTLEVTVKGEVEIRPGIRTLPVPGHTPGSQAILVDTDKGRYVIAGDAVFTYENLERDIPPGFHHDVDHSMESMELLRSRADHVLPSHDYTIFSRGRVATFPE